MEIWQDISFLTGPLGPSIVTILLLMLIMFPLIDHLIDGWAQKAQEIQLSLNEEAKRIYLEIFQRKETVQNPEAEFAALYRASYFLARRFQA